MGRPRGHRIPRIPNAPKPAKGGSPLGRVGLNMPRLPGGGGGGKISARKGKSRASTRK